MELHEYIKQIYEQADGDLFAVAEELEKRLECNMSNEFKEQLLLLGGGTITGAAKYVSDTYHLLTFYPKCDGCKGGHDKCCRTE